MDMPPSRYKVVEEGRRLVVVDRLTGERVRHQIHETPHRPDMPPAPRAEMRAPAPAPRGQPAGLASIITTQPWYDDKAPRTLVLGDNASTALMVAGVVLFVVGFAAFVFLGFVAFFVGAFILAQKGTRAAIRRGVTAWLDTLDPA